MPKKPPALRDVHLFAPLGSNPAQLTALTWALARERGLRVVGARVVLFARGAHYLERELLGPKGGLEQLHDVLGADHLPRATLRWTVPLRRRGVLLEDDSDATGQSRFGDVALREASASLHDAGELPVVFALVGGRRRTLTVLATLIAQHLARPNDYVVDLRFDPHDAEAPGRFFFPTQRDQLSLSSKLRPHDVTVRAVDVQVPRLRALLGNNPPATFDALLTGAQSAIDSASPLRLELDLRHSTGDLVVRRESTSLTVSLGSAERLVLGAIVRSARRSRAADRSFPSLSVEGGELVRLVRELPWTADVRTAAIRYVHTGPTKKVDEEDAMARLRETRSRLVAKLRQLAANDGDPRLAALVPERDPKTRRERFRLHDRTELLLPPSR